MRSSQRGLRWGALLLLAALSGAPNYAHARVHHTEAWARDHFSTAERMREALNGRPPADRTRHDYQRVINAYCGGSIRAASIVATRCSLSAKFTKTI